MIDTKTHMIVGRVKQDLLFCPGISASLTAVLRSYWSGKDAGKFAECHQAFAAHDIGDLSQPLHYVPSDDFNKDHHPFHDGRVERHVMQNLGEIRKRMSRSRCGRTISVRIL